MPCVRCNLADAIIRMAEVIFCVDFMDAMRLFISLSEDMENGIED